MPGLPLEANDLRSRRRRDAMLMALLSFFVVLHRRWNGEPLVVVGSEAISVLLLFGFAAVSLWWRPLVIHVSTRTRTFASASFVGSATLVPTANRFITHSLAQYGSAWEMVMLTTLGIAAMVLVFCSRDFRHTAIAVVCSGFLMLFTTSISDHREALYFAILWVLVCLYWLVANHWERLEVHLAQSVRHERSLRFGTTAMGVLICGIAGIGIWGREPATRLIQWGIMPTSGGQRWNDPSARSGVGDGDAVVAAKEHAASFGPVESELFLQSDLPSLFDMFDDTLGEITMKKRSEKAMALPNQTPVGEEQKFSQTQQGNASFSIAREAVKEKRKLEDKNSAAVLHWVGPSGISLAMERFDRFDGVDWSQTATYSASSHRLSSNLNRKEWDGEKRKQVWYFHDRPKTSALLGKARPDAVKFINLKSARIPTPAETQGVHVADVDRDDFFAFTPDGSWIMPDRETVPSLTVVRLISREIDADALSMAPFPDLNANQGDAIKNDYETNGLRLAKELANQWTQSVPRGWPAIEQIVERLRSEFVFDRGVTLDTEDPLFAFLNTKHGGDHLFATAAVAMLDSQGYSARLATGFYCDPKKEDSFAGHTEIGIDDAHVWAEVMAGEEVWVPIEPTPSFVQPRFHRTLWNRALSVVWMMLPWLGLASMGLVSAWCTQAWWGEWVCRFVWWSSRPLGNRSRLSVLVRLLDWRSRLAGSKRPIGITPRRWFTELTASSDEITSRATRNFFDAADAVFYAPHISLHRNWIADADRVARQLTVRQLQIKQKMIVL